MATFPSSGFSTPTVTHVTPRPVKPRGMEEAVAVALAVLSAMEADAPRENAENAWSRAGRQENSASRLSMIGRKR